MAGHGFCCDETKRSVFQREFGRVKFLMLPWWLAGVKKYTEESLCLMFLRRIVCVDASTYSRRSCPFIPAKKLFLSGNLYFRAPFFGARNPSDESSTRAIFLPTWFNPSPQSPILWNPHWPPFLQICKSATVTPCWIAFNMAWRSLFLLAVAREATVKN